MNTLKETFADLATSYCTKLVLGAFALGAVPYYFLSLATTQL